MNKELIFPASPKSNERVLRVHWSSNKTEDLQFDNNLETFSDVSHGTDKLILSSCSMCLHPFMGTACAWKVYRLIFPMSSSDTEIRVLFKSLV